MRFSFTALFLALAATGTFVRAEAVAAPAAPAAAAAGDGRSVTLILDASGSMKAKLPDGTTRIDAAKAAVKQMVGTLPAASRLSFWAYGHQSPTQKKDCKDLAQLAPFNTVANNKTAVVDRTTALKPQGYTPITYSLTQAAKGLATEEAASHVVVLVSDGKETCASDPCAAAKALADADAKLVVHTVGIGVDEVTRNQLKCIASNARGSYFDANSTAELSKSLGEAAVKEATVKKVVMAGPKLGKLKMEGQGFQFVHYVVDGKGKQIADFAGINKTVELPAGIYGVTFPNKRVWTGIEVKAGETTEIKPGFLKVQPNGDGFVEVLEPETGEKLNEVFKDQTAALIPGQVDVRFGKILWPGGVALKPGETVTLKPGVVSVVKNKPGGPVLFFAVKTPNGQEAGKGNTGQARVALPPGKYVVELDMPTLPEAQRKMNVDLVEGQETEIKVD